jgi:hypothetical protein
MNEQLMIPRCMSTQHPDNAQAPFFAQNAQLSGEEEVREAFYVYNTLGCEEQMWDHEGKEVDVYVVPKLLAQYPSFFRKKKLGRQVLLTLRVPNPVRERASAKGLLEILGFAMTERRDHDLVAPGIGEHRSPVAAFVLIFEALALEIVSMKKEDGLTLGRRLVMGRNHDCHWLGVGGQVAETSQTGLGRERAAFKTRLAKRGGDLGKGVFDFLGDLFAFLLAPNGLGTQHGRVLARAGIGVGSSRRTTQKQSKKDDPRDPHPTIVAEEGNPLKGLVKTISKRLAPPLGAMP